MGRSTATVQLFGRVERGRVLTRSGANIGDDIYVTGTLGDSAAGIALMTERVEAPQGSAAAALKDASIGRCRASGGSRARAARERRDRRLRRLLADRSTFVSAAVAAQ